MVSLISLFFCHWKRFAALSLILVAGLAFRLYDLGAKSIWFDEHGPLKAIASPSLGEMLSLQAEVNSDMLPLYFIFQYYWFHYVGNTPISLRCLSILFGMLAIVLIYLLARTLYTDQTSLLAAACLAFSAFQILHSQVMRPYSLMCALAFLSAFCFWQALRRAEKRWWVLYLFVNAAFLWSHVFASFLVIAQGAYLLCCEKRHWGRLFFWGATQLLLVSPVAALVLTWENRLEPPLDEVNLLALLRFFLMDNLPVLQLFAEQEFRATP